MKKFVVLTYVICTIICANAQSGTVKYFIGAFNQLSESESVWKDGLNRIDDDGVIILITNKTLQYKIALNHFSYLNKSNDPVILDMPIAELENLENVAPATELLNFENADSAYKWMVEVFSTQLKELVEYNEIRSKIFIIDTNKFYKSKPELEEADMMKVVEVRVWPEDIPDHILNPL